MTLDLENTFQKRLMSNFPCVYSKSHCKSCEPNFLPIGFDIPCKVWVEKTLEEIFSEEYFETKIFVYFLHIFWRGIVILWKYQNLSQNRLLIRKCQFYSLILFYSDLIYIMLYIRHRKNLKLFPPRLCDCEWCIFKIVLTHFFIETTIEQISPLLTHYKVFAHWL